MGRASDRPAFAMGTKVMQMDLSDAGVSFENNSRRKSKGNDLMSNSSERVDIDFGFDMLVSA
jgi:hypothetical protein